MFKFNSGLTGPFGNLGSDLDVNERGWIYAVAPKDQHVRVFDSCGDFLFQFENETNSEETSKSIAINKDGQVIVASFTTGNFYVFNAFGKLLFKVNTGAGILGLSVDEFGHIFAKAREGIINKILVYDSCGNFLRELNSQSLTVTTGIDVNSDGQIAVTSLGTGPVVVFDKFTHP